MLDYSKVVQLLKREFPSITQEEIDYMISTLPANMPYSAVKALVKMTKHLQNNPAKMKLLKLQIKQNVQQNVKIE